MIYKNYFNWLSKVYNIEINSNLQNIIEEYLVETLNIYTEQDMYEKSQKVIQKFKEQYLKKKFYK